ncbi:MAG: DUF4340 domain-containing protein, partial [Limisphaerales bacterium]
MNFTTTRWLVSIALVLAAFILLVERRGGGARDKLADASLILPGLDGRDVTGLEIRRGTNYLVRLRAANGRWIFVAPFIAPAVSGGVERLITGLAGLQSRCTLSAQEVLAASNGPAAFGFDRPAVTVSVERADRTDQLRLGSATLLGRQLYAQLVGREGLFTIDSDFMALLPAGANDWRNSSLLQLAETRIDRIEVRPSTNGFELVRHPTNRLWSLTRPLATLANNARIEALLAQLDLTSVSRFVTDDPHADLEPYGLQSPERELTLSRGGVDVATLQVGRSPAANPDQVYLRILPASNVVEVARTAVAPWLARFSDFCDRRLMIFRPEAVDRIEAFADEAFAVQRVGPEDWRIVAPYEAPADRLLVLETLAELASLQFIDFERMVAGDFAPYGLDPPRRQYTLLTTLTNPPAGPTNQVVARVSLGKPGGNRIFARRMQDPSVVTFLDADRLPRAAFALRDQRLWNFSTNQILSLTVSQLGDSRRLVRTGPIQWANAPGSVGEVNP